MEFNNYEHNAEIMQTIGWYGERIAESMKKGGSLDQCQHWLDRAKYLHDQQKPIPSIDF